MTIGFVCCGFAVIIPEVLSGAGRYGPCLSPEDLQRSLMLQLITQPLYVWSILLVKVSIVFCLLRFLPSKNFSRFLWGLMIFFIVIASMYFITKMLQCQPLNMVWILQLKAPDSRRLQYEQQLKPTFVSNR